MKNKIPKTIADLDINWTFCEGEGYIPIEESKVFSQFRKLNPLIWNLIIKSNRYLVKYNDMEFVNYSQPGKSLAFFITYFNYVIWKCLKTDFKLSHFERISDTEYIIHGK